MATKLTLHIRQGECFILFAVLFAFWNFYGIITLGSYLLDKLEFDEVNIMIDITAWTKNFLQTLNETFANRVWFVGLHGSYGRG